MSDTPRSAIVGVGLQILGVCFGLMAVTIWPRRGYSVETGRYVRRCHSHAKDIQEWLLEECRRGDHRYMATAAAVAIVALILIIVGRRLAKRSGLD